jgi:hypothetical protein
VDGATSYKGSGIGVTMVGLQGEIMNYALSKLAVGGDLNKDQFVVVLKGPKLERLNRHRI